MTMVRGNCGRGVYPTAHRVNTHPRRSPVQKGTDDAGPRALTSARKELIIVLTTLLIILVILWLLGVGTSYTLGGLIHVLLVIAVIIVLLRVIQGRHPLRG